jgi:hypothetical protein
MEVPNAVGRSPMSWSRFVPGFSRHPKRLQAGHVASWLWICSVDYCTEFLTDGWIPQKSVHTLCPTIGRKALRKAVLKLLEVGSWESLQGGYRVHDYLRHNSSKSQVEEDQEQARKRYHKWKSNAVSNAEPTPLQRHDNAALGLSVSKEQEASKKTRGENRARQRPPGSNQHPDAFKKSSPISSTSAPPSTSITTTDDWLNSLARVSGISRDDLDRQIADERARRTQSR